MAPLALLLTFAAAALLTILSGGGHRRRRVSLGRARARQGSTQSVARGAARALDPPFARPRGPVSTSAMPPAAPPRSDLGRSTTWRPPIWERRVVVANTNSFPAQEDADGDACGSRTPKQKRFEREHPWTAWSPLWEDPSHRLCPLGVSKEALAERCPERRMMPALGREPKRFPAFDGARTKPQSDRPTHEGTATSRRCDPFLGLDDRSRLARLEPDAEVSNERSRDTSVLALLSQRRQSNHGSPGRLRASGRPARVDAEMAAGAHGLRPLSGVAAQKAFAAAGPEGVAPASAGAELSARAGCRNALGDVTPPDVTPHSLSRPAFAQGSLDFG